MLKNKLREKVRKKTGGFKKKNKIKTRPDSDLPAAEERQVKGRFLCLLEQEVGTMQRWFEHRGAGGKGARPERLQRHRRYQGSNPDGRSSSSVRRPAQ